MLTNALRSVEQIYRKRTGLSCISIALIVLVIDYVTGKHIEFPIVYALPVGMAAWRNKKTLAYLIAMFLPLARVGFHFPWHETQSLSVVLINVPITVLSLSLYVYYIDRISWQKKELEKEVKALEGILPICASCKKIRNEKGEYEQLEKYVTEHSEASFSHGICPECARKMYPEYFKE